MGTLAIAVRAAAHWRADQTAAREELTGYLRGMIADYEEAIGVWQDYVEESPSAPVTGSRWTIINWIGEARARRLWTINRRINDGLARVAMLTGAELPWSFPTDEVMIDVADKQLVHMGNGTGRHAARVAIERLKERVLHTRALLAEIQGRRKAAS